MPWTYDPEQLSSSELYQVRAEIQDTDPQDQQLMDEEIAWAATQERNFWCTSARCLEMISRAKLRKADVMLGRSMKITYTKMAEQLTAQAKALRQKGMGTVVPWVGGMSVTDKLIYAQNQDLVQPLFTKTMMENPWTGGYLTDSLDPIVLRTNEPLGSAENLFTGDAEMALNAGYSKGGRVFIRQSDPLPITVLAVIPSVMVGG